MTTLLLSLKKEMRDQEFVRLFVANQRRIHGFVRSLIPQAADADDVLQETSITGLAKFASFTGSSFGSDNSADEFVTWICTIARYEALKYCRQRGKGRLMFDEALCDELAERRLERMDEFDKRHIALQSCLAKLTARDRDLLRGRYESNLTGDQLADQLGRPRNTVYKALQRIRRALTECVQRSLRAEGTF